MLNASDQHKARQILKHDGKIKALHFVMQRAGVGISDAKRYVDTLNDWNADPPLENPPPESGMRENTVETQVCAMLERSEKIQAITYVKEETGLSLVEAKQYVERLALQVTPAANTRTPPEKSGKQSFFTMAKKWSPAKKALLFVAIFVIPYVLIYLAEWLDKLILRLR